MKNPSQQTIIGIDVSRDRLDFYCLPDGGRNRYPNTDAGHQRLLRKAKTQNALVCFEATGGHEWRL